MNFKNLLLTVIVLLLPIGIFSCEKVDPMDEDPMLENPAIPETLECNRLVEEGASLTLEDRGDGIDYIIDCVASVRGDLIIDPGVTIQFGTDAGIDVDGTGSIQALGTTQDQVVFTGEDKIAGAWKGILIDSNDPKNKIEYATIEYAGGDAFNSNNNQGAVIVWSDTRLNMNNTTITNSKTYGFNASYGGDDLSLDNNTITACDAPMYIEGSYPTTISRGSYTGNTLDAIIIQADQITGTHNWANLGVPYHVTSGLTVRAGGTLTIMPGAVLKFGQDSRLYINEGASGPKPSLIAVGTATEPIVFTSIDNTLSAWRGIYFDSPSSLNEIGFTTIENASNGEQDGAIEMWYGTVLNVHDVLFKNVANCAIQQFISGGGTNTLTTNNLSFDNVGTEGICQN